MIRLHQFEISPFCDKIRRVLHVKGLDYEVHEVNTLEFLRGMGKINPIGKLPCLEHDGRFVPDSTEIAHYLEERFPEPALVPEDPRERALCHVLEDWADESLYFQEMTLRFTLPHNAKRWVPELTKSDPGWFRPVAGAVLPTVVGRTAKAQGTGRKPVDMLVHDVERQVDAVADLLGRGDWLVADALSLADIAVFAQLFCIRGADEGAKLIEARPSVAAWMARVDGATAPPG